MNRFALLVAGAAVTTVSGLGMAWTQAEHVPQVSVVVDLSERSVDVLEDGEVVKSYAVAVGHENHPTPTGEYTIDHLIWNPGWIPPEVEWAEDAAEKQPGDPSNPMQGAKIFFREPDYYLHGTNAPESIGEAASHGCVRMRTEDVQDLAERLQKAGGADRSSAWFASVRSSETDTEEVHLPEPIQITVRD